MKNQNRLIYIIISLFACGCLTYFLNGLFSYIAEDSWTFRQMDPLDNPPWYSMKFYQFDPFTILTDIENGRENVFRLLEDGVVFPEHPSGSFPWISAEYLTIAKTHHLYLTGEPAEREWKIFVPGNFEINQCRDEMKGFDSATIIFYKREASSFAVTYIEIQPLRGRIGSAYTEYEREHYESPIEKLFDDPDEHFKEAKALQGNISAEDALQIAENAGGKEMRQKLSNDGCQIDIAYFTDKWVVWYYWWSASDLRFTLSFDVNAENGNYKIEQKLEECERTICP